MAQTRGTAPSPDPHGQVALKLCESLLHVLVEQGLLTNASAVDVIETVIEVLREAAESRETTRAGARGRVRARAALALAERIRVTFASRRTS